MHKTLVLYIVLTIGAFIGWVLVPTYAFFLFFWMLVLLFIINIGYSFLIIKHTKITYALQSERVLRKQNAIVSLRVDTYKYFPTGKIVIVCHAINQKEKKKYVFEKNTVDTYLEIPMLHCGMHTITIEMECYYDILHLLFSKRKQEISKEVMVYPLLKDNNDLQLAPLVQESMSSTIGQEGQDYSEVFDIRGYRQGDTLRHMHWKLSMKKSELLVKTGSQLVEEGNVISYLVYASKDANDQMLDMFHTLCTKWNMQKSAYTIYVYDATSETFYPCLIHDEVTYYQTLCKIMTNSSTPYTMEQLQTHICNQAMYIIEKDGIVRKDKDGGINDEKISLS